MTEPGTWQRIASTRLPPVRAREAPASTCQATAHYQDGQGLAIERDKHTRRVPMGSTVRPARRDPECEILRHERREHSRRIAHRPPDDQVPSTTAVVTILTTKRAACALTTGRTKRILDYCRGRDSHAEARW